MPHSCQSCLQPPNAAAQVLRGRSAEGLDEPLLAGMELVHVLDVIASCGHARAWLAADNEVFQADCGRQIHVAVGTIRAEHRIAGDQRLHCALERQALAVREAPEEARASTVSDRENG